MRMSDWSSDVCSSDLLVRVVEQDALGVNLAGSGNARTALLLSRQRKRRIRLSGGKVEALTRVGQLPFGLEAFFFRLFNDQPLCHRLSEGGRVLEGKTTAHQRIAPRHPRARRRARRSEEHTSELQSLMRT